MGAAAASPSQSRVANETPSFWRWFGSFLAEELAPYPGRAAIVARMVSAATLTMILIMTFRLPNAALAAYYTLVLSRESPATTLSSAIVTLGSYLAGTVYLLIGAILFIDYPLTHFLWVAGSLFLAFFVLKVSRNVTGASAFGFLLTIALPIWDQTRNSEQLVTATLWAAGSVSVGLGVTLAVEYVASLFEERNELVSGLSNRLSAISASLSAQAHGVPDRANKKKVAQLAVVGVSRLRRLAADPSSDGATAAYRSTTIALVGRLIDLCATIPDQTIPLDAEERIRVQAAADKIAGLQSCLLQNCPPPAQSHPPPVLARFLLLPELERTAELLAISLSSAFQDDTEPRPPAPDTALPFVPDAFTNPEHLAFSLRGCLAATLCYVIYTAVAWPGINTCIATCVLTALSTIGASRQRQLLRIAGAIVGGLILGIGAQVFIIPQIDSLIEFTVLFVAVTLIAAWLATATPRLSYFGLQMALAFYLIHLQEYYPQTNLAIARDRVAGVALGLIAMGLVFDTLGSRPAMQTMRDTFAKNLGLLATLADPWREAREINPKRVQALRDQISANFAAVNAQGDAVLFEIGASRARDLQLRGRLLSWQPLLRSLYLLQIAELHYRAQIATEQLPPAVLEARIRFDRQSAALLHSLSEVLAGKNGKPIGEDMAAAHAALEQSMLTAYGAAISPRSQAVLALSSQITGILQEFRREIEQSPLAG
jgi:multidrug resistance protein MdtO